MPEAENANFLPVIISFLYYIVPIVFIIWFLINFLKIQKEKNLILRDISDKIDKLSNDNS